MDRNSFLQALNPEELDKLYQQYLFSPDSVSGEWADFFRGFDFARQNYPVLSTKSIDSSSINKEFCVLDLIAEYRKRGHYFTKTNPVRKRRTYKPDLALENFGLNEQDLQLVFSASHEIGLDNATLSEIIELLKETYCASIGVEYMYIRFPEIVDWLQNRMESKRNRSEFSQQDKKYIHQKIASAVLFEKFLQKRFTGQKRFSLEGAESLIPSLQMMVDYGAENGVKEFVFGMAHRGRLNVLANIFQKPAEEIFNEFAGKEYDDFNFLGDVKYHLGMDTRILSRNGLEIGLILCPNPSHLEAVGPVAQGLARARIENEYGNNANSVIPVIIHGDSSIAGQGVVYEQIQMSELPAYKTGGTVHIVINNQIGFTTNYLEARSSIYCTDVAKIIQSPIFHVNGDDVEAVAYVVKLALDYRLKFNKDVFIDLLCYRRYGHNESDEPRFTQPDLYKIIEKHPDTHIIYSSKLIEEKVLNELQIKEIEQNIFQKLDESLKNSLGISKIRMFHFLEQKWRHLKKASEDDYGIQPDTTVNIDILLEVGRKANVLPSGAMVYQKIHKILKSRLEMLDNGEVDWGLAEQLAFGTLLNEGKKIRFTGQDVERGTFSHRHAVLTMEDTFEKFIPLNHIRKGQAEMAIYNSLLSEYAVMGFEFGYALNMPDSLNLWEAQFGDFANGAQIIIDQFIVSSEEKWNVFNNLILLLPHGYEGQGPEHSSARIERFLNMSANYNLDILYCSTPANFFHALRRHLYRDYRKPLVVFTPKSLLRHPLCMSKLEELSESGFKDVIDDTIEVDTVKRIILCSGKIYYDLLKERKSRQETSVALIRIEQYFPFPVIAVEQILERYRNAEDLFWLQEEPVNMGAWKFISQWLRPIGFKVIARPVSGSPATGSLDLHKQRHQKLIDKAFTDCNCERSKVECKMICLGAEKNSNLL